MILNSVVVLLLAYTVYTIWYAEDHFVYELSGTGLVILALAHVLLLWNYLIVTL